jgi:hypothetical protein
MDITVASVHSIHEAFARRLTELNRQELLAGGTADIQFRDPVDILRHCLALAAGMHSAGHCPPMDLVIALGAQVTALGLSVARVEDMRIDLGDDAA